MTSSIGKAAAAKTVEKLRGAEGVQANLAALSSEASETTGLASEIHIRTEHVAAELAEKTGLARYPSLQVHCVKIVNDFKEKFRTFSGRVWMEIEVRHSQDRLEGMEERLQFYVDSVAMTLDGARGDWGEGMYYAGGYEVEFGPVKQGGRHLIQTAAMKFAIETGR